VGGIILALLPTAIHNLAAEGDLVPTTSQGGLNFYIGNSPQAQGAYYTPAGMKGIPEELNQQDSALPAERALGRHLKPSEVSNFWFDQGMNFISGDFGKIPQLYWQKFVLTFTYLELPSTNHITSSWIMCSSSPGCRLWGWRRSTSASCCHWRCRG
jgi:hypothetical protein